MVMQEHVQQIRRMAKSLLESGDEEKVQGFIAAFLQERLPWPDGATRHLGLTPEELERLEQENRLRLMEEEREGWPQEVQADEALPPLQPRLISRP
jgi:Asp-tRNA(Asn)/Glu-tRNA(Gln) amidotransferase C subunit